jgi:hypothetical protein
MPLHLLNAPGAVGSLYVHLFENPKTGTKRGLYWSVTLPCAPVRWDDEDWDCAVTCEWLQWPIKRWMQLDGLGLRDTISRDDVECSVYLAEHHPVEVTSLALSRIQGTTRFRVTLQGSLDINGFDELDGSGIPVHIQAEVDFEGIVVVPGNLTSKPNDTNQVLALLSPFIDTDDLDEPQWDRFRYVLKPPQSSDA